MDNVEIRGNGGRMHSERTGSIFHNLLAEASLPETRFHNLRHSAATILLVAGVHPKVVLERMSTVL